MSSQLRSRGIALTSQYTCYLRLVGYKWIHQTHNYAKLFYKDLNAGIFGSQPNFEEVEDKLRISYLIFVADKIEIVRK